MKKGGSATLTIFFLLFTDIHLNPNFNRKVICPLTHSHSGMLGLQTVAYMFSRYWEGNMLRADSPPKERDQDGPQYMHSTIPVLRLQYLLTTVTTIAWLVATSFFSLILMPSVLHMKNQRSPSYLDKLLLGSCAGASFYAIRFCIINYVFLL